MQINSIRFKATVLYSLILTTILAIFSFAIYLNISSVLYQNLDRELKVKADEIAAILHTYEKIKIGENDALNRILYILQGTPIGKESSAIIDEIWQAQLNVLNLKNDYINVVNSRGDTLLNTDNFTENIHALFKEQFPICLKGISYKSLINKKFKIRAIAVPISYRNLPLVIQIGVPLKTVLKELNSILFFIIISVVITIILTSFIGTVFAYRILKPVTTIINLAETISHGDLNVKLQEREKDTEIKQLVNSFNVMIARLRESFQYINEFSSHVAHELKTPLAIIKGEIELALSKDSNPKEYKKVLSGCLEEIDRIIIIIRDLLLLARLEHKPDIFKFGKLNLAQFIEEIYEHSKILASSKNIEVKLNNPLKDIFINGDKTHLRRLFYNIIGNAVKFTPPKGNVIISLSKEYPNARIDISDTGEGIAEENLPKIFEKFYRVHKEDKTPEAGIGLGLNIAFSIAKAHRGDIKVKSTLNKGTTFSIFLPLA